MDESGCFAAVNPVNDAIARPMDGSRSATLGALTKVGNPTGCLLIFLPATATASLCECRRSRKWRSYSLRPIALTLLELLDTWYQHARVQRPLSPGGWLFPGQNPVNPLSTRQLSRTFHLARKAAGTDKAVSLQWMLPHARQPTRECHCCVKFLPIVSRCIGIW